MELSLRGEGGGEKLSNLNLQLSPVRTFTEKFLYTPRPNALQKARGPSAGSSFEQISMQRLTGVPSPISGGTGWMGSGWTGIFKGWGVDTIYIG